MNNQQIQHIEEDEIDLRELWKIIAKRKYLIIILTIAITLLAGVYVFSATPMYEARALIEIGNYNNNNNNNKVLLNNPSQLSQKLAVIFIDTQKSIKDKKAEILSITVPKKAKKIIEIKSIATSNQLASNELNKIISYIQQEDNLILKDVKNRRELEIRNIETKISNIQNKEVSLIDKKITLQTKRLNEYAIQLRNITNNINKISTKNPTLAALLIMQQNNISDSIFDIDNNIIYLKNKKDILISTSVNELIEKKNLVKSMLLPYKYRSSQVVAKIITNDAPVKPKKKLIVVVAFITGLILSIFLVFFLDFISKNKEEN